MKTREPAIRVAEHTTIALRESSDTALVIYTARNMAAQIGFDETRQYLIASAVSELATNIIRYAGRGSIVLAVVTNGNKTGIEVCAEDFGPGIADIEEAMQDNFSTGNGLGLGLPSVRRTMDEFEIRSGPESGTQITALKWNPRREGADR